MIHDSLVRAEPSRVFLRVGDGALTFGDVNALSDAYAVALDVAPGERVALQLTNRPEFFALVTAITKSGGAAVLLSPAWKEREVAHALAITGAPRLITDTTLPSVKEFPSPARQSLHRSEGGSEDDDAILVFSSGTTGLPKAVRHTHRSLGAATQHWVTALGLGADDRFQVATPPSHILGLLNLLAAAEAGVTVRLHPRFDLDECLRRIETDRLTLEMAVAPIALAMANHPSIEDYDLSSLRYIMWGATPVTESVAETVTKRTGVGFLPAYGASEFPVLACNPVADPLAWRLDSAGLPPRDVELRVVDLDTRAVLAPGGVGEIQARGPSVMAGYLPEDANAEGFEDGWYRTGDVGWIEDDGWVHLTDRSKEMIKVSGFQVAPAEIEAVLHGHPAVLDCAVFGLPDEQKGEVPVAVVQTDGTVTPGALQQLVADSLATYKQVRHVVVVDDIPRLPSGKVLRRTLRDEWTPKLTA
ncbi:MAG TPA: AMP-binding protein [Acidimicrobiales bacterium]|nr:AMP-binding protein [Acidimicrobiales bacterium]